jgi:hypothetical protein
MGFREDFRAEKQPEELFIEAASPRIDVATAIGVTDEYSTLERLSELLDEGQPQSRNMDEVDNYIVGTGRAEIDDFISVFDVVGSGICIASEDGQKLHNSIKTALVRGKNVYISFRDIANLSAAFLDAAIGKLCNGEFTNDEIRERIFLRDISQERVFLIRRTIQEAKEFYIDPGRFKAVMENLLVEDGNN